MDAPEKVPCLRSKLPSDRDVTMSEMVENPTLEVDDLDDAAIPVAGQPTIGLVSFGFARRAGVLLERQEHSERHLLYRKPLNWTAFAEVQRMAGPLPALRE